jgi:hypothetical protein
MHGPLPPIPMTSSWRVAYEILQLYLYNQGMQVMNSPVQDSLAKIEVPMKYVQVC